MTSTLIIPAKPPAQAPCFLYIMLGELPCRALCELLITSRALAADCASLMTSDSHALCSPPLTDHHKCSY